MEITERDETLGISRQIVTFLQIYIYIYKWIMELKSVKCLRIVLFYFFFLIFSEQYKVDEHFREWTARMN